MKRKNRYLAVLIILVILSLGPGRPDALALSIEDEETLGRQFLKNVRDNFELVGDDFAVQYINDLGNYLITPLETKPFHFRFYIIRNNELNAFAAPGGHIFIYTGLINAMEELDELAAVICHEIGHVSSRHLSHRIETNKKVGLATMAGMLAGSLIGGKAAGAIITGTVAAGIQTQLSYSRDDERQADQLGVLYMDRAGFDPSAIKGALDKIHRGEPVGTDRVPSYLRTHPTGPERMSNMDIILSSRSPAPEKVEAREFRKKYPYFQTILKALYLDPDDAERLFNNDLKKDPDSTLANFGLGIVFKERTEYTESIGYFKKALQGAPDTPLVSRYLGEDYQLKGENEEAVRIFERLVERDREDKAALFLLALSYQNLEQYARAIRIYDRLTSMKPVKNEVYYNLGVSLGRENRLGLAHYNFGIYFKRLGETQKADFHFKKAEEFSGNDPVLKSRIRAAMEDLKKEKPAL